MPERPLASLASGCFGFLVPDVVFMCCSLDLPLGGHTRVQTLKIAFWGSVGRSAGLGLHSPPVLVQLDPAHGH
eukprot:320970-Alexandrium_andersonii.AAC.1